MPTNTDRDLLLESHEDRLQAMEQISRDTAAALSRIGEALQGLRSDVCEMREDLGGRLDRVEVAARADSVKNLQRDAKVTELDAAATAAKERRSAIIKWAAGIGASLFATALALLLGLK